MKYALLFLLFIPLLAQGQKDYDKPFFQHRQAVLSRPLEDTRMHDYNINFYHLNITADNTSTDLQGSVRILATVEEELSQVVLELTSALDVSEIRQTNTAAALSFSHSSDLLIVELPENFEAGEMIDLTISYGGIPPANGGFFQGISNDTDSRYNRRVTWTLSEPFNAKDWFPVKQVLSDKADSAYIYITVDEGLKAGAPGLLTGTTLMDGGKVRYEWQTRHPIAYYLISMAIADYQEYTLDISLPRQPSFPMVNYIYDHPEVLPDLKDEIDITVPMMELFAELFGPYPYADEKYGHAMAPMGGGMEHQTMSTMQTFTFGLNAHELAHQWFGDYVTCGTWQDIWINEGFARYGEYLAAEFLTGRSNADAWMRGLQDHVKGNSTGSIYVPEAQAEDPGRIFEFRLTYNKGGAILHTLRYVINDDELFFSALRSFLDRYRNGVATGKDFRQSMETDTNIDLVGFFDEWYFGAGYPIYDIVWQHRNDSLIIDATQQQSAANYVELFTTPMPIQASVHGVDTLFRFVPSSEEQTFKVYLPGEVTGISFDPDSYLIKNVNSIRNASVTSAEPLKNGGIRVFPNPARDHIQIVLPQGNARLRLNDLQGRLLHDEAVTGGQTRIDTGSYTPGIYIVTIKLNNRVFRQKIVIR